MFLPWNLESRVPQRNSSTLPLGVLTGSRCDPARRSYELGGRETILSMEHSAPGLAQRVLNPFTNYRRDIGRKLIELKEPHRVRFVARRSHSRPRTT